MRLASLHLASLRSAPAQPTTLHIPNISPSNPGKMLDYSSNKIADMLDTQFDRCVFSPLRMFGSTLAKNFNGTIFRFPLRSPHSAETSRLSKQAHTEEKMVSLLEEFGDVATEMLLFLKNLETLECYTCGWIPDPATPTEFILNPTPTLISKTAVNSTDLLRTKRAFILLSNSSSSSSSKSQSQVQVNDYAMSISHNSVPTTWVVCNQLGGGNATVLASNPDLAHMKLIPWAGVAARLDGESHSQLNNSGKAYCFLPLPVKTGLNVHVNGYFELSSNRRDVWQGDDMAGDGAIRAEWNVALCELAASCYARLLHQSIKHKHISPATHHSFLPVLQDLGGPLWVKLAIAFYAEIENLPVLHSNATSSWEQPSQSVLFHSIEDSTLSKILDKQPTLPLVHLPDELKTTLLNLEITTKTTTPQFVRSHYSSKNDRPEQQLEREDAKYLLEYSISDLTADDYGAKLHNLPFLPVADRSLQRLQRLVQINSNSLQQLISMGFTRLLCQVSERAKFAIYRYIHCFTNPHSSLGAARTTIEKEQHRRGHRVVIRAPSRSF
mgnify:FL=1